MYAYPVAYPAHEDHTDVSLHHSRMPAIVEMIGNTPLLELRSLRDRLPDTVRVYAKAEWTNPGGSVKDRAAYYMIRDALDRGTLQPGQRILDATSGNTGIALAMIGTALGLGVTLCLPANASEERKKILAAYGAEVLLTDPLASTDGARAEAERLVQSHPGRYHYISQYANPANVRAHFETTGPEIWRQTHGHVTHFVAGLGTTGTFVGTSRFLKRMNPAIQAVSFQGDGPMHGLEGIKHLPTAAHIPEIYDASLADGNDEISTDDAYAMLKRLAREEGLLVGVSAAAAAVAALKLAETLDAGVVVTIFPDRADKYLSLPVWSA
jgi:cysteine synthase B